MQFSDINIMCEVSYSKGVFYCNRGPGKGLQKFKMEQAKGWGLGHSSVCQNRISLQLKETTCISCVQVKHAAVDTQHEQMNKDTPTVYISPKMGREDSAANCFAVSEVPSQESWEW